MFFSGFGVFHTVRFASLWHVYRWREKTFNVAATGFIFAIAAANFYAAHEINMGKEMTPVTLRPSYSQRFREAYTLMNMKPDGLSEKEKQDYYEE